ncbi:MAG: PP2C family protein-serine/threonine phosphatase [Candidatus Coatesbacteria bacterium]|nr:PP2C family protein-serine/threonine phosphatase [Candidatus Coatesbacteria bacterium]
MVDFRVPYLNRVLKPLISLLGGAKATKLLYECFADLGLTPFILKPATYHELVQALTERLKEQHLADDAAIESLSNNWSIDAIAEDEVLSLDDTTDEKVILPSDADSICRFLSDAALKGSVAGFTVGDDEPNEAQKAVLDATGLVLNSISKLKENDESPYSAQAGTLLATQLERYERITAFSRNINTVDMDRLREKMTLLADVLAVGEVAVFTSSDSGSYEPFYVSVEGALDDFEVSLLLASIAEEVALRRNVVSGFEQELENSYQESVISAGLPQYWAAFPLLMENDFLGAVIVFDDANDIYTEDEANAILRVCNHIASALQSCIHHAKVRKLQQMLDDELRGVGSVQKRLLPEILPKLKGCEVSAYYQPSGRASGDYYDVVRTSESSLSFVVADVSGHGAPAAVVMAMSKTAFRLLLSQMNSLDSMFPVFNNFLCDNLAPDMFVTAMGGIIDTTNGEIRYTSAGHNPAIIARAETKTCELLDEHDMLLGVLPDQQFTTSTCRFSRGDKLIVYTDGITEAKGNGGEEFGLPRLIEAIKKASNTSSVDVARSIISAVTIHMQGQPPHDDMTLLIFSF